MIIRSINYLDGTNFKAFEMNFSNKNKEYTALFSYCQCILIQHGGKIYKDNCVLERDLTQTTLKHIKAFCGLSKKEVLALNGDYSLENFTEN